MHYLWVPSLWWDVTWPELSGLIFFLCAFNKQTMSCLSICYWSVKQINKISTNSRKCLWNMLKTKIMILVWYFTYLSIDLLFYPSAIQWCCSRDQWCEIGYVNSCILPFLALSLPYLFNYFICMFFMCFCMFINQIHNNISPRRNTVTSLVWR